jgi:hypothetical protein
MESVGLSKAGMGHPQNWIKGGVMKSKILFIVCLVV